MALLDLGAGGRVTGWFGRVGRSRTRSIDGGQQKQQAGLASSQVVQASSLEVPSRSLPGNWRSCWAISKMAPATSPLR